MRLLAEGRFAPGAGPAPFLLYMNITVGALLATLYRITNVVPWYDLFMMLTMVVSSIVLVKVWIGSGTIAARIGAGLLAGFFLMPAFATPQFSMAGMTAATAGLALLARPLTVPLADHVRRRHLAWGVGLLVWGALIRWEASVLLLGQAAFSVAGVCGVWGVRGVQRIGSVRPVLRAVAIASVLLGLAFVINLGVYRSTPAWRDFYPFNLARAQLGEYSSGVAPSAEVLAGLRRETGWSANDLELLRHLFFVDTAVFTLDKLYAAQTVIAAHAAPRIGASLETAEQQIRARLRQHWAALFVLAAVVLAGARPGRRLIILAWFIGVMYALLIVISATLKVAPFHLYWTMMVLVAALLPLEEPASGRGLERASGGRGRAVAAALLLTAAAVVLASTVWERWDDQRQRRVLADTLGADVTALRATGATLVGLHANALPWEYFWRPFRQAELGIPFIDIGVSGQTPPVQDALARYGARNFVQALCSHDQWLLVARRPLLPRLTTFMTEHHQRTAVWDLVLEGREISAWRCRLE